MNVHHEQDYWDYLHDVDIIDITTAIYKGNFVYTCLIDAFKFNSTVRIQRCQFEYTYEFT